MTKLYTRRGGLGTGAVAREFALIEEGNGEEGGAEDEERENAIGAIEEGEVVQEDFHDDDAEKDESLPAKQRPLALRAEDEEKRRVDGPEDGNREMLSEGIARVVWTGAEEIPKLLAKGEKSEKVDCDGEEGGLGAVGF